MAQIVIRNIDDVSFNRLKKRAAEAGLSAEAYLRQMIERQYADRRSEALAELKAMWARSPGPVNDSSVDIIRAMRDDDAERH